MVARMAHKSYSSSSHREHALKKRDLSALSEHSLREDILHALASGAPLRLDDFLRKLALSRRSKRTLIGMLRTLESEGLIVSIRGGAWAAASRMKKVRGVLSIQRSGAAFARVEKSSPGQGDVFIAPEHLGDAWDGDTVELSLFPPQKGRKRNDRGPALHAEGQVLAVLERPRRELTACVLHNTVPQPESHCSRVLCRPADPRLRLELLTDISALPSVPEEGELLRVTVGQRIDDTAPSARSTRRGRRNHRSALPPLPLWSATAIDSLGREDDARVQEDLTKLNHRIPTSFPDDALQEAELSAGQGIGDDSGKETLEDLRHIALVTIDGEDARDFDDAVFVAREEDGWRLLVAIADVSHYVRPRGALDREARERGNSYYFPTSVEPMLPEALSNGACSLRPDEDRRAMVADMRFDASGIIRTSRFSNAVIRSRARLIYTQVEYMLENGRDDSDLPQPATHSPRPGNIPPSRPTPELIAMLKVASGLAETLIKRRHDAGALDFDLPEAEFTVEENRVTGISNRNRLFSHRLIEAFMIAANEAVARFLTEKGAPFPYRVHPAPSPEKLEELGRGLMATGLDLPLPRPADFARDANWLPALLNSVQTREDLSPEQIFLVNRLCLRSMMQARYDPEEGGHFGLASACYCHFTSPIRRYADLITHRALKYALGLDTGGSIPTGHKLLAATDRCNERERAAQDAEREITRRFGCLLLRNRVGETFGGVVCGVTHFGLFVELEGMPLEGMIRVETLGQDFFEYDAERQELRGIISNIAYRLGQRVQVRLIEVNPGRLEINLALLNSVAAPAGRGKQGKKYGKQHPRRETPALATRSGDSGRKQRRERGARHENQGRPRTRRGGRPRG